MLFVFIKILYIISVIPLLYGIVKMTYKKRYKVVTSLVFWMVFFYFCYITFPCLFIEEINTRWGFTDNTLITSRCIVAIYNLFFAFFIFFFCKEDKTIIKDSLFIPPRYKIIYQFSCFVEMLSIVVIVIAIIQLLNVRKTAGAVGDYSYFIVRGAALRFEAQYHIRMFLYMLIPASFFLYYKNKRLIYFLPLLLVAMFETLANQRTTAFIVLIYLYIMYVVNQKKLALKVIIPVLGVLLIGVLFVRAKALGVDLGWNIIFGEFFETFTTLPFIIEHNLIGRGFNLERILSDCTYASFLPGTIKTSILSYESVGVELAHMIGRGYGLGSNFISEQIYELGYAGFLSALFIPLVVVVLDKQLRGADNLLIKIIFVVQLRLFIREGITQFTVAFYILAMYFAIYYVFKKRRHKIEMNMLNAQ